MWRDPIVEEIQKHRQEYGERFNHDPNAICCDLRELQKETDQKVVSFPPRPRQQRKTDGQSAA